MFIFKMNENYHFLNDLILNIVRARLDREHFAVKMRFLIGYKRLNCVTYLYTIIVRRLAARENLSSRLLREVYY